MEARSIHPESSYRFLFKPNLKPLPVTKGLNIQLQTNTMCNGECIICPHPESWHRYKPGSMSEMVFDTILTQLESKQLSKVCLYLQNEPLTDPLFFDRLKRVGTELQFGHIEISTNAALLAPEKSIQLAHILKDIKHEIWISFHGCDERTYSGMMG